MVKNKTRLHIKQLSTNPWHSRKNTWHGTERRFEAREMSTFAVFHCIAIMKTVQVDKQQMLDIRKEQSSIQLSDLSSNSSDMGPEVICTIQA